MNLKKYAMTLNAAFRRTLLFFLAALVPSSTHAEDKAVWNKKSCAVCLTYDDALNAHLDHVVPLLDSLDFRATFYLPGFSPPFRERSAEWKTAAAKGNELGNHTLFHPCEGKSPGREWVKPGYDLTEYTVLRMTDEIDMANVLLHVTDGKMKRTFAYPCGDVEAGDSSYVDHVRKTFVAARGVQGKMQRIDEIDLFDVGAVMISGQSGDELIALVKQAMEKNALLVFLFHGVGGGHSLNVSLEAHSRLLHYLKQNERDIWVAPLADIAETIRQHRLNPVLQP
jgi:peptidoglycan/xylan/chitin deacetylase (PgdA/CDA1 family)